MPGTRQETDTISRLVYGFATAYLLHRRRALPRGGRAGHRVPARAHALRRRRRKASSTGITASTSTGDREEKVFASEFGDDYDAIPAYEQIYALAGPIQTYRITGDPRILRDAEMTVDLFERFFADPDKGGYFSHVDPINLDPQAESLGHNRAEELELGRRPRPRVPDQPVPGHRGRAVRRLPGAHLRHDRGPLPRLRQQPVRPGAFYEDWSRRPRHGAGSRTAPSSATTSRSPGT